MKDMEDKLERIKKDLEEFIKEHKGHTIASGMEGAENRWRVRCKDCYEDFIVDLDEIVNDIDEVDAGEILDVLVDDLAKKYNCKVECLNWL